MGPTLRSTLNTEPKCTDRSELSSTASGHRQARNSSATLSLPKKSPAGITGAHRNLKACPYTVGRGSAGDKAESSDLAGADPHGTPMAADVARNSSVETHLLRATLRKVIALYF